MTKTWLGPVVAVMIAMFGVASLWGSERARASAIADNLKIQEHKIERIENRLSAFEIENAKQREILHNIDGIVKEIKEDVKALRVKR
jgi:predicted DNA-binding protein YlxM (UPF0122 family)